MWLGMFTELHPLLEKAGWAAFAAANVILILQAMFRKKRSNVVGEFHAMNAISWIIAIVLLIIFLLLGTAILWFWTTSRGGEFSISEVMPKAKYLVAFFATSIAYGWLKWFFKIRPNANGT